MAALGLKTVTGMALLQAGARRSPLHRELARFRVPPGPRRATLPLRQPTAPRVRLGCAPRGTGTLLSGPGWRAGDRMCCLWP
jgi:hypothetical protein